MKALVRGFTRPFLPRQSSVGPILSIAISPNDSSKSISQVSKRPAFNNFGLETPRLKSRRRILKDWQKAEEKVLKAQSALEEYVAAYELLGPHAAFTSGF